ncbi:MAG: TIGR03560 family F420-dependent LLM class oxidoreductase [Acidimicrobiales bacterium]|nr:TIGR03560 family F420-dependent LLM class oxidoreductase [Acidimicrobiales bacterium]
MRFAIKTSPQYTTWDDMLSVWTTADEIELFESAWNFDHFYPINVPDTTGPCMEGWITLTALAQATRRIRIGCLVTGVVYRHPAVLANMAATLDIVSGGRLELGVGAGWNEEECTAYGIELGTLTERFDRFDEACAVLTTLLTNEVSNFEGRYFTLRDARNNPPPVQRPHPPICIGGTGEKRTLPAAARWAQHWNYPGWDADGLRAKLDVLHQACADIGRDPAEILVSQHIPYSHADGPGATAERIAANADAGLQLAIIYLPPPHDASLLEPLADALAQI